MALSLSCGRRRQRRCRHFHVHYHLPPRRVCVFSLFHRWLPRFSVLPYVLILPVLFFAVLAFLVSFVWFTLLYFVGSLLNKDSSNELFKKSDVDVHGGGDADDQHQGQDGEEEGSSGEMAVKRVAELTGDPTAAEVFDERFKVEEVHVKSDGMSRKTSCDACINYEVNTDDDKLLEEVIIFETKREEELKGIADLDGLSGRQPIQDVPIDDWFVEEIKYRDVMKSGDSFPIFLPINISDEVHEFPDKNEVVGLSMDFLDEIKQCMVVLPDSSSDQDIGLGHEKYGEEFVDDTKEVSACYSSETSDLIDKHETREVVVVRDDCANDDTVTLLASSDSSAHDGIIYEHKKDSTEQKDVNILPELFVDRVANSDVSDEQQEIQKMVVVDDCKPLEVLFLEADGEQIVGTSDELNGSTNENETSGFPSDSVCQDKNVTVACSDASFHCKIADKHDKCEDVSENNREKESGVASIFRDCADKHENIGEAPDYLANEDDNGDVTSLESSVSGNAEDKDEKSTDNCTSKGALRRLPNIRRSPSQWWNLCGVIDAFVG